MSFEVQIVILVRLIAAFVAGVIVGYDRERSGKAAGIRTQMLVCVGSALLSSISVYLGHLYGAQVADPARLMAQIVSGIGFLGAGVILKNGGSKVVGVTTAATIWITAAIGIAIGAGFYLPAVTTVVLVLMLNPLAALQYHFGLKGSDYLLEIKKIDQQKVSKAIKRLGIRIKNERVARGKQSFVLVSSERKNDDLSDMLNRRGVDFRLEKEDGEL